MKHYLILSLTLISVSSYADIMITPMIGYTIGGEVKDAQDNRYDIQGDYNYSIAIEIPVENGRIGLFYTQQDSQLDDLDLDSPVKYLYLQSSLDLPINDKLLGYVGIGLGGSYIDVDWAKGKVGFSATGFAGLEYKLTPHIALNAQFRWLGTTVDSSSSTVCYSAHDVNKCYIHFESDWMNQFQSNVGFTFRF